MDRQRDIRIVSSTSAFERDEGLLRLLRLPLLRFVLLLLQFLLQGCDCRSIECRLGNMAMLESSTIEAWLVVIISLSDDLAAIDDDATVFVVQRGLGSLLEAERQIRVSLHFVG